MLWGDRGWGRFQGDLSAGGRVTTRRQARRFAQAGMKCPMTCAGAHAKIAMTVAISVSIAMISIACSRRVLQVKILRIFQMLHLVASTR